MAGLQGGVLFVVLLGVLITVHELGHFLIAKWLNVKVLRFSIGFGPKLFGFTKGETEYQVAILPLGGYVKMAGELPYDEVDSKDAGRGFLAQPPWKRALIVIGGPAFNLAFPILIYFVAFIRPQEMESTHIRYVQEGLPAASAGILPGDKVTAIDGSPVKTFQDLATILDERMGQSTKLTVLRGGQSFDTTLTPAATFEARDLESAVRGTVGISPNAPVPILGIEPGSPAAQAGLKHQDQVVAVNGSPVSDVYEMTVALKAAPNPSPVLVLRHEPLGLPGLALSNPRLVTVQVPVQQGMGYAALGALPPDLFVSKVYDDGPGYAAGLRDGDRIVSVDGQVLASFGAFQAAVAKAAKKPFEMEWRSGGETKKAKLAVGKFNLTIGGQKVPSEGVGIVSSFRQMEARTAEMVPVQHSVGKALRLSGERLVEDIRKTVLVLKGLIVRDVAFEAVGGPIMMYQLASKASELGWEYFFGLMAIISVNLGIMNLLPIPVLDGFALLSAAWEAIRRRPIPTRAREIANMIGLTVLLVIMVRVMINDVTR